MAPAAAILAATALAAAAGSKRPADADAELAALPQGDEAGQRKGQQTKQQQQQQLECPRCRSTNTKFCYYNNYSTAQPRHFCRACRRYWTHGGTLRDVPVGGASRRAGGGKRRRVSAESSSASSPPQAAVRLEEACPPPDLPAFPFLSDGSFLPQFDFGDAPAAFSWPTAVPDFFDGLATWDAGTVGAAGVAGAWGDLTGLELSWPPPGN